MIQRKKLIYNQYFNKISENSLYFILNKGFLFSKKL